MKTSSLSLLAALYLELVDDAADEIHGVLDRVLAPVVARRGGGGGGAEARAESGPAVNIRHLRNRHLSSDSLRHVHDALLPVGHPTAVLRRETAKPTLVEVTLVLLAVPFAVACGWFIDRGPFKIRHWEHESCPVKGQYYNIPCPRIGY